MTTTSSNIKKIPADSSSNLPSPHWHKNLDSVKSFATQDNIIISKQHINKDKTIGFSYSTYPLFQLPDYILSLPEPDRNIFEYLRGSRKGYFDTELERQPCVTPQDISQYDACVNYLLQNINTALTSRGYSYHPNSNLIRQTSHGPSKLSNHFIIDRYFFSDGLDAKSFYEECIRNIPHNVLYYTDNNGRFKSIIDGSVYTNRPFRLPFCTKLNRNRHLLPDPESIYVPGPLDSEAILAANPNEREIILKKWYILHSMICYTADCTMLPSFKPVNKTYSRPKVISDAMMNKYIDYYNEYPEINSQYDINYSLSKDYLYLQRKGSVICPIKEHGGHEHNNSKICTDYDNKVAFKCFGHKGRKILGEAGADNDPEDDDEDDNNNVIGGFNMVTGSYDPVKVYEDSFFRKSTPDDVLFFINSLEKAVNFTIDSKTLRQQFTKYCNKNKLDPWFNKKAFNTLLLQTEGITTARDAENKIFIVGYTLSNVDGIVRADLPENIRTRRRQPVHAIVSVRTPWGSYLPPENNTAAVNNITTVNDTAANNIPKVFVKRPATTDDVKYFIDCLIVKDLSKSVTCPELYTAFNNYCNRSELYTSVTNRMFTDYIVKSGRYHTAVQRKIRCVIGISLANAAKITRQDHMFRSSADSRGISTAPMLPSGVDHLLNTFSTNNNIGNIDDRHNVPQTDKSTICNDDKMGAVDSKAQLINEPPIMFDASMLRDFWDSEMVADPHAKVNIMTVYNSHQNWCKENNIYSTYKCRGLARLFTTNFMLERSHSNNVYYINGWNVRRTLSNAEHAEKQSALHRIFTRWTDRYEIGRHNGPYPYYHLGTSRWKNIHVKHEYVYTKGTNGRILLPGIDYMTEIPGRDIERDGFVLAIKADMGAGKTEGIKPYIEANPNMKVLYVVPVISLANKMLHDLEQLGFNIYSDQAINSGAVIEGHRICTTYNSLYKIVGQYDMVVFDEYRLIQKMQFASILKKKAECYRAFCYRLQTTPKVIVADALLENKHVLQLKDISCRAVTVYQCMNKIHDDKDVVVIDGEIYAINSIIAAVTRGERVAVPTGGAKYARFIRDKLLEINPDLKIGLYTKEEMKTIEVDVTTLWDEHTNIIIYTPTILAGASYLGEIDAVYALFLTNTCCPDAAAQMMLRCRKARKYYVCVKDTHLRKIRIGEDLYPSYSNTLMWLDNRERLYKTASDEEDVLHAGLILGTGELEQNYLQLYASYCQDEEKARKHYLFYLLIYLRDMGFKFGGLKSAISDEEKEAINVTKLAYSNYSKEINENYWNTKAAAPEITYEEYIELDKKPNKNQEDINKLDKYQMMKRYDISSEVITGPVMKYTKGNDRKHDNLRLFQGLSGIQDDNEVDREINNLYLKYLPKGLKLLQSKRVPKQRPFAELTGNIIDGSSPIDSIAKEYLNMTETEYKENMLCCIHTVKILRLFGLKDFMELYSDESSIVVDTNIVKPYIDSKWKEIVYITRLSMEKTESYIDRAVQKILDKSFGMAYSYKSDKLTLSRGIFKKVHGKIVHNTMDSTKIVPNIQQLHIRNVLNNRNVNTPQHRALVLNVIRSENNNITKSS